MNGGMNSLFLERIQGWMDECDKILYSSFSVYTNCLNKPRNTIHKILKWDHKKQVIFINW